MSRASGKNPKSFCEALVSFTPGSGRAPALCRGERDGGGLRDFLTLQLLVAFPSRRSKRQIKNAGKLLREFLPAYRAARDEPDGAALLERFTVDDVLGA